jgi:hypothetical protein
VPDPNTDSVLDQKLMTKPDPDEKNIFFRIHNSGGPHASGLGVRNVDAVRAAGVPDLLPVLQDSGLAQGSYQVGLPRGGHKVR